jgi:YkoP domain
VITLVPRQHSLGFSKRLATRDGLSLAQAADTAVASKGMTSAVKPSLPHSRLTVRVRKRSSDGEHSAFSSDLPKTGLTRAGVLLWKILAFGSKPGNPRGLLVVWPKWEQLAHRLWPVIQIPNAPYRMLQIRVRSYRGPAVRLSDASLIRDNSLIAELHCNNRVFLSNIGNHDLNPYSACREDLHSIADWMKHDSVGKKIEALYGSTMLTIAAARLGFILRESPHHLRRRFDRFFMIGLLILYTRPGLDRLARGTTMSSYPMEIWMARHRLLKLYGDRPGHLIVSNCDGLQTVKPATPLEVGAEGPFRN